MNQDLSVIIPAYNAEKYLAQAVDSVRSQAWEGNMELIVIDDGSTDRTVEIAKELGCAVISQNRQRAAHARNEGIKASHGGWIYLLDSDDVCVSDTLAKLYAVIKEDPETVAVFGLTKDFVSPEITKEELGTVTPRPEPYEGILPGCSLIRRDVFDQVGLFVETLKSGETVDWMMKLRASGLKTAKIKEVLLNRRIHLTNTGRTDRKEEMKNYAALLRRRMSGS